MKTSNLGRLRGCDHRIAPIATDIRNTPRLPTAVEVGRPSPIPTYMTTDVQVDTSLVTGSLRKADAGIEPDTDGPKSPEDKDFDS
jgi:hypothetical protein